MLVRIVNDLQITDARLQVAAVLDRLGQGGGQVSLGLTQAEIGDMAGATRRQVHAAIKEFADRGWLVPNYRRIEIRDPAALHAFYQNDL